MELAIADSESELDPFDVLDARQTRTVRYFGDYELIEEIARGGMGVVYRARQVSLNRPVALKMIPAGQLAGTSSVQRFHTEAEAAARLDHPQIVPIYEIGEHDGQHYFSMKLIEGGTLAQLNAECRLRNTEWQRRAAGLLKKIADAVHYAHQHGILHRDLKPTNILMDSHAEPQVSDFGLAKLVEDDSSLTMSIGILGTPSYMAPEQAAGGAKQLTIAADTYSLGAILYELLTGQPPFRAATTVETLRLVSNEEPVPPHTLNPVLNRDLETICLKCLNKDLQKRYSSAGLLGDDLEHWLNGEPIIARPAGAIEKLWRWCRRRPVTAGLLLALLVVFASGLAGIFWQWRRAEHNAAIATEKLIDAYTSQARALRGTDVASRRFDSLAAISNAASLNPSSAQREALRNEAIACFALPNLRLIKQWPAPPNGVERSWRFDSHLKLYARVVERGEISICQVSDDHEVARLPKVGSTSVDIDFFSLDSRFLAVLYDLKTNAIWDIARREVMLAVPYEHWWNFSPDSRLLGITHPDGAFSIYSTDTWKETRRLQMRPYLGFKFSPDGAKIYPLRKEDDRVEIADLRTGNVDETLVYPDTVYSLNNSSDGHVIAAGMDGGHIVERNLSSRERIDIDAHQKEVTRVAFNHAGNLLASLSRDGKFRLWSPSTGHLLISGPGDGFQIQFSDDDRYLGYADTRHICLFEVTLDSALKLMGNTSRQMDGYSLAFSPDGRLLATCGAECGLWDVRNERDLGLIPENSSVVHFLPDGKSLIIKRDALIRWPIDRVEGSTNILRLGPKSPHVVETGFGPCDLTPNGRFLVAGQMEAANVYDLENESAPPIRLAHSNILSVAISPDGRYVATGGADGAGVKVWEVARAEIIKELPAAGRAFARFSSDGRWLATASVKDSVYRLYQSGSWKLHSEILTEQDYPSWIENLAFSPDGEVCAIGNSPHNTQLYSTATGHRLAILDPPHQTEVGGLAFSPDGTRLAVLQRDRVIQLWDLRQIRQELALLGLDWDQTPYPAASSRIETGPMQMEIAEEPRALGLFYAQHGRFMDASRFFAKALETNPDDHELWHFQTAVMLQIGRVESHRELCAKSIELFRTTTDPNTAERIAKDYLILPSTRTSVETAASMADFAVSTGTDSPDLPWFQFAKGLAEYRLANFGSATEWLNKALAEIGKNPFRDTEVRIVLAMALHQAKQRDEARAVLVKALETINQSFPNLDGRYLGENWIDMVFAHALLKEARPLVQGQQSAARE